MSERTMMPEVLPDPELALALRDGDPRERTAKHLARVRKVAAIGVALTAAPFAACDPAPAPSTSSIPCEHVTAAELEGIMVATASWKATPLEGDTLEGDTADKAGFAVVLTLSVTDPADTAQFTGTIGTSAGTSRTLAVSASELRLAVFPGNAATVDVSVGAKCSSGFGGTAVFRLDTSGAPAADMAIRVTPLG